MTDIVCCFCRNRENRITALVTMFGGKDESVTLANRFFSTSNYQMGNICKMDSLFCLPLADCGARNNGFVDAYKCHMVRRETQIVFLSWMKHWCREVTTCSVGILSARRKIHFWIKSFGMMCLGYGTHVENTFFTV